jgi:hypothetical protein
VLHRMSQFISTMYLTFSALYQLRRADSEVSLVDCSSALPVGELTVSPISVSNFKMNCELPNKHCKEAECIIRRNEFSVFQ